MITDSLRRMLALLTGLTALALTAPVTLAQPVDGTLLETPYPESGRWGPRDGTRTGIYLEIQNGVAAGLWAGYDANGDALWLSFSGPLAPLQDLLSGDQIGWKLVGRLTRFSDGGCILIGDDCDGSVVGTPDNEPLLQWIRLQFTDRSTATLEVLPPGPEIGTPPPGTPSGPFPADAPVFGPIDMVPLVFGVAAPAYDPASPLQRLPDFEGDWSAARADPGTPGIEWTASGLVQLGPRQVQTFDFDPPQVGDILAEIRHPITRDSAGLFPENSELLCIVRSAEPGQSGIDCGIDFSVGPMLGFAASSLSDARLYFRVQDDVIGHDPAIVMFRLGYD